MARDAWILVVDDDDDVRTAIAMTLRDEGYRVMTAEHGGAALVALLGAATAPACILSDARMPVMDGWALWCEVANRHRLAEVPFILMSCHAYERAKVDPPHVLAKPIDIETLLTAVSCAVTRSNAVSTPGSPLPD